MSEPGQNSSNPQRSVVEVVKGESHFLRGTLVSSLSDPLTGAIAEDDTHLSKFHGIYQQDDRDLRLERQRQKLEPAFAFMIRARVVAGRFSCEQWIKLDDLVRTYAHGALRLTTRQTFQLHNVRKNDLKACVQAINGLAVDTLAACGDVNRNVMCTPVCDASPVYQQTWQTAVDLSKHLSPQTRAYAELWLDEPPVGSDEEPFYGATYLPRKFKIGFAIPPINDVDIYTQDLGFIAIHRNGTLLGFNVTIGGGLGMSHGDPSTYARLGTLIGFCPPNRVIALAEAVVSIQRDEGSRAERSQARLKYTLDRLGLEWFCSELEQRVGFSLGKAKPMTFTHNGDAIGWRKAGRRYPPVQGTTQATNSEAESLWNLTLFIPGGRIQDEPDRPLLTCLREIAEIHSGEILFTPNQNLIFAGIREDIRPRIEALLKQPSIRKLQLAASSKHKAMACVALPTCGLAMAEAERLLPTFLSRFDALLEHHGLLQHAPTLRITGCPNGCARPYVAEIALIGKAPGRYNLMLGGSPKGDRLNWLYRENQSQEEVLSTLDKLLGSYVVQREKRECFGDFMTRLREQNLVHSQQVV